LSPAAAERIAMLMEEAGEVVQACGKILRHGMFNHHPVSGEKNNYSLVKEIRDFMAVANQVVVLDTLLDMPTQEDCKGVWLHKQRYMHHKNDGASSIADTDLLRDAAPDLLAACKEFVRKVEAGEAKSTRSYRQMKEAITKAEGGDDAQAV